MRTLTPFLALFMFCTFASAETISLFSREVCMTSYIKCEPPTVFVHDAIGRCGCLEKHQYMPIKECIVSNILCPEGSRLSHLTNLDGQTVGCGCYKTAKR